MIQYDKITRAEKKSFIKYELVDIPSFGITTMWYITIERITLTGWCV